MRSLLLWCSLLPAVDSQLCRPPGSQVHRLCRPARSTASTAPSQDQGLTPCTAVRTWCALRTILISILCAATVRTLALRTGHFSHTCTTVIRRRKATANRITLLTTRAYISRDSGQTISTRSEEHTSELQARFGI